MNSQKRFTRTIKTGHKEIQTIDGIEIDWGTLPINREDVNVDVFCKHGSSIYSDEFLEKTKSLIFFSKNPDNINKCLRTLRKNSFNDETKRFCQSTLERKAL